MGVFVLPVPQLNKKRMKKKRKKPGKKENRLYRQQNFVSAKVPAKITETNSENRVLIKFYPKSIIF